MSVNLLLRIGLVALDVAGLLLIGLLVAIVSGEEIFETFGLSISLEIENHGALLLAAIALFFSIKSASSALLMFGLAKMLSSVEVRLSAAIAQKLFLGPPEKLKAHSPGEIFWVTGGSVTALVTQTISSVANIVGDFALLIAVFGVFLLVDPVLSSLTLSYFLLVSIAYFLLIGRRVKFLNRETAIGSAESSGLLQMLLGVFRELVVRGSAPYFLEGFRNSRFRMAKAYAGVTFVNGLPRLILESAMFLGVAVLFWSSQLGIGTSFSLVNISIILVGGVRIVAALIPLQRSFTDLRGYLEQAKESRDFLLTHTLEDQPAEFASPTSAKRSEPVSVSLKNVVYSYPGADGPALRGVSLNIARGEFCAIIGASGAGKTSMIDAILGFIVPQQGTVHIEGREASKFVRENPGRVGYVPQRPGMVPGTVADNILLGSAEVGEDDVRKSISLAGLGKFIAALPHGIDASMGKHFDGFSGGQLQRLAIARAISTSPGLIILDEATSSLDLQTEAEVISGVISGAQDVTRIVIAHRLSTIQNADKVVLMEAGEVVDVGTFSELRSRNQKLRSLIRLNKLK